MSCTLQSIGSSWYLKERRAERDGVPSAALYLYSTLPFAGRACFVNICLCIEKQTREKSSPVICWFLLLMSNSQWNWIWRNLNLGFHVWVAVGNALKFTHTGSVSVHVTMITDQQSSSSAKEYQSHTIDNGRKNFFWMSALPKIVRWIVK